ncbi:MAG: pseudouridine synthase [Verrucomicrobia bacterium]|nr:pseudouridine synthase [Verrucomicrobiota bacterium]
MNIVTHMSDSVSSERLQVFLAKRGVASRRACAELIRTGRVSVNGAPVCEPGFRVKTGMLVTMDGAVLSEHAEARRSIILYKPTGYICSTRRQSSSGNSGTVYDLIRDIPERILTIGRLDKDSEGLIVLSNDGSLTEALAHPRQQHRKTYEVTLTSKISRPCLMQLNRCRTLENEPIQAVEVTLLKEEAEPTLVRFVLREGRNRQIRRMCREHGLHIARLVRTQIGDFGNPSLSPGEWRDLLPEEIALLLQQH